MEFAGRCGRVDAFRERHKRHAENLEVILDGKTTCMMTFLLLSSHFYPPIEGLALGGSVVSNRPRFTITNRGEALCRYAVLGHPCDD